MNKQDYEQKKRECWENVKFAFSAPNTDREAFDFIFDRAYALGKQEKDAEDTTAEDNVTISLHVAVIPSQEEFYMGVDASHEAYTIDISKSMIPSDLLAVINGECKNKLVTNIAIMK